ncbi:SDR family oxidoreductase [soil metagenome]
MEITGSVAIVTGAAGGIGAAIAQRLLEHGAHVVLSDLDAARVEERTAILAQTHGASVVGASADAASDVDIARLITTATESFGPVDFYFANAGVGLGQGLEASEDAWDLAFEVNVRSHVRAARLLVPGWLERGQGYFFSTASAAGILTQLGSPTYAVSKHAAVAFSEWLAVTYGDRGVRVSCLCPMGVNTNLLNAGDDHPDASARVAAGAVKAAGQVREPLDVADRVIEAIGDEHFLVLPHPEVLQFWRRKVDDYDRWIGGMQRLRSSLDNG